MLTPHDIRVANQAVKALRGEISVLSQLDTRLGMLVRLHTAGDAIREEHPQMDFAELEAEVESMLLNSNFSRAVRQLSVVAYSSNEGIPPYVPNPGRE